MERERLDDGVDPDTARLDTVLGQPIEEIEKRKQTPLLALDFVFRPQASLTVLWALGDDHTRRVIERAHERAIATVLRWLEDEIAETRWSSGRKRAKTPALIVARFRHFDNRDGSPLLHDHCLIFNRVQRPDGAWYALDTRRLYQHVVAAGTLYTLTMTTEVCEELGLATVPREVTPGLRPVMEIAGVGQELIDWSSTRRQQIEDALEGITDQYVKDHGRLPGERARHGLGRWAAQNTRPEKKTPRPLHQLRAWWRASAIRRFGQQLVDGLLRRCRAAGAAIRARVQPLVDTGLAAIDVAAVVYTVRGALARRHVLAEARRHLAETLRGRACPPGLDDYIADQALTRHTRQLTVPRPGRRSPELDQITYTADFRRPARWWIAGTGKPPRAATRYERAQVASLALQNAIRTARAAPPQRGTKPTPRPLQPPRTPRTTTTTRRRPHRTPSTTRTGPPSSPPRIRPPPTTPTSRPRCRSTWRAGRRTPRRGCARRRTSAGSPPSPARPTPAAALSPTGSGRSDRPPRTVPPTSSSTTRPGLTRAGERPVTADGCRPASVWPICAFTPSWPRCGSRIEKRWHPSREALGPGSADTEQFLHRGLTLRPEHRVS
ncbi:MobF family relaxase [Streptomyces indonesiensis]